VKQRNFGLDLFRVIAIFLVVQGHSNFMFDKYFSFEVSINFLPRGVDMFFVLSGFLIGYKFIKAIGDEEKGLKFKNVSNFWIRTSFRLLPLYYLMLTVNFILAKLNVLDIEVGESIFLILTFTQNLFAPIYNMYWEAWSLSVQVWFYILFPLMLYFVLKYFSSKKTIIYSIFILILLPLIYRIFQSDKTVNGFLWDIWFRKLVITRIDTIGFGVLAAFIKHYYLKIWRTWANYFFILGLLMLFILSFINYSVDTFYAKTYMFTLIPLSLILLLPKFDVVKTQGVILGKIVSYLSLISYSIYLTNLLISQLFAKYFEVTTVFQGRIKYFLFWIFVILLSAALYQLYEKPLTNLRNKFVR